MQVHWTYLHTFLTSEFVWKKDMTPKGYIRKITLDAMTPDI